MAAVCYNPVYCFIQCFMHLFPLSQLLPGAKTSRPFLTASKSVRINVKIKTRGWTYSILMENIYVANCYCAFIQHESNIPTKSVSALHHLLIYRFCIKELLLAQINFLSFCIDVVFFCDLHSREIQNKVIQEEMLQFLNVFAIYNAVVYTVLALFEIQSLCSQVVPAHYRRIAHWDTFRLFHACFWKLDRLKKLLHSLNFM